MKFPVRSRIIVYTLGLTIGLSGALSAQEKNSPSADQDDPNTTTLIIPGPLRSFLRMAAISQETRATDVLPMLARNSALYGYEGERQTEYLILVDRYVHQARELQHLAGADSTIRVEGCAQANQLLDILGYKFERGCAPGSASLVTANPERAFVTIDSGFPLTALEEGLASGRPFVYSYPSTRVPMFFQEKDWAGATTWSRRTGESLLDELLHDQNLDRLYAAMANCDHETRSALLRSPGLKRLVTLAGVFDLYGREISVRSGAVVVPDGGEKAWEELVGASVHSPGDFVFHLLDKDNGWMAAYFDTMSRLSAEQQGHFTDAARLKRVYHAYRSTASTTNAAHGVFPRNADLLVFLSSAKWEPNGDLFVPGGMGLWQEILAARAKPNSFRDAIRRSHCCERPESLLDALAASTNLSVENGPSQIFLMLTALDSARPADHALSAATQRTVALRYGQFNLWFPVFAEFPALDDTSVNEFVSAADRIDGISNTTLRANALGAFQAEIGLWQIFARQGQIPKEQLNGSWQKTVQPYNSVSSSIQLFDAARSSLRSILQATSGHADLTQDQIVDLLAGPRQEARDSQRVHAEIAARIQSVLDDQRLASLDALFGLYDGLTEMAKGSQAGANLLPLAESLREFEMPRPIFTGSEKTTWAPIVYSSRHAELQVRTDLTKIMRSSASPAQLESARSQLTPFLRDTLVGLNYAYYEPPGAEVLHNNPLFIRSHDFSSISVQGIQYIWGYPELIGVGATAGGGAYLMGSLADLPYALASTEEDFIAPKNVQALVWKEVVPDLLVSSTVPRWWTVSKKELHAAALYQSAGEEILEAAPSNPALRDAVIHLLADRMAPYQLEDVEQKLRSAEGAKKLAMEAVPADSLYLAESIRQKFPDQATHWGRAAKELDELIRSSPEDTNPERIARDFGVPHPTLLLTNNCTLLNVKPVAAVGGNNLGLLAESWQSNNLYWARLADEKGYSPVMLNLLAPTLTRRMVTNIFASNIDDWPALARAMRETGDEFRQGKIMFDAKDILARQ